MKEKKETEYVVYEVTILNEETNINEVVYIGSGTRSRSQHAKSGKSTSVQLNEAFFKNPSLMNIIILREGLTKSESLELEKEYITATLPKFNIQHNPKRSKVKKFRHFTE